MEEKRKQQMNDMSDGPNNTTNKAPTANDIKKQNQQMMETPLYDGSDRMQTEQLSDRVVQPTPSDMGANY